MYFYFQFVRAGFEPRRWCAMYSKIVAKPPFFTLVGRGHHGATRDGSKPAIMEQPSRRRAEFFALPIVGNLQFAFCYSED